MARPVLLDSLECSKCGGPVLKVGVGWRCDRCDACGSTRLSTSQPRGIAFGLAVRFTEPWNTVPKTVPRNATLRWVVVYRVLPVLREWGILAYSVDGKDVRIDQDRGDFLTLEVSRSEWSVSEVCRHYDLDAHIIDGTIIVEKKGSGAYKRYIDGIIY